METTWAIIKTTKEKIKVIELSFDTKWEWQDFKFAFP